MGCTVRRSAPVGFGVRCISICICDIERHRPCVTPQPNPEDRPATHTSQAAGGATSPLCEICRPLRKLEVSPAHSLHDRPGWVTCQLRSIIAQWVVESTVVVVLCPPVRFVGPLPGPRYGAGERGLTLLASPTAASSSSAVITASSGALLLRSLSLARGPPRQMSGWWDLLQQSSLKFAVNPGQTVSQRDKTDGWHGRYRIARKNAFSHSRCRA